MQAPPTIGRSAREGSPIHSYSTGHAPQAALNVVGHSVRRLDALEKVTGQAGYTATLQVPGMVHGAVLRSPLPHARIRRIDTQAALAMPGVVAILTAADLPEDGPIKPTYGPVFKDQPIVARDRVRFVGEAVAAVAAETLEQARRAAEAIAVDYEELPALTDALAAAQPGAPLVHEQFQMPTEGMVDVLKMLRPRPGTNIFNQFKVRRGDVAAGFAAADYIAEGTYHCPPGQHAFLEPHGALAAFDLHGRLTVHASTQTPYLVRNELARIFGLPLTDVRVIAPYLGGGFGGKAYPRLEPITAALAHIARRPVRLIATREEEFLIALRHGGVVRMKTGVRKDGTITARQAEMWWDCGAYADVGPRLRGGTFKLVGPYRVESAHVDGYCIYTNNPPGAPFRGFGTVQTVWASENNLDECAAGIGLDPVELRLRNIMREGDAWVTGEAFHGVAYVESLQEAARRIGWTAGRAGAGCGATGGASSRKVRGVGLAVNSETTITPSASSANVRINDDGSLTVYTSTVELGQGGHTIMAQIAAEAMGIPMAKVRIVGPDTDVTPYDLTTSSSRSTYHMGQAIQAAVADARSQVLALAADLLEAPPADLELVAGQVRVKGLPARALTVAQVLRSPGGMRHGTVMGRGSFASRSPGIDPDTGQGQMSHFWGASTGAAEVEVDLETGQVAVLRYASVTHSGNAVNPNLARGQSEGSVIMGLGQTFMEYVHLQNGQPTNGSFLEFHIPAVTDLPPMDCSLVPKPYEHGPFGAKGLGEADIAAVAGAVANAVFNATGIPVRHLPIAPARVLAALREPNGRNDT